MEFIRDEIDYTFSQLRLNGWKKSFVDDVHVCARGLSEISSFLPARWANTMTLGVNYCDSTKLRMRRRQEAIDAVLNQQRVNTQMGIVYQLPLQGIPRGGLPVGEIWICSALGRTRE